MIQKPIAVDLDPRHRFGTIKRPTEVGRYIW
jgi:hypothetical protein